MLTRLIIQRYKSLYDVTIDLEPLTVFIGPNGSGKSNICEALFVLSYLLKDLPLQASILHIGYFRDVMSRIPYREHDIRDKFWHGDLAAPMSFGLTVKSDSDLTDYGPIFVRDESLVPYVKRFQFNMTLPLREAIKRVAIYDFNPALLSQRTSTTFNSTGQGIGNALATILGDDRKRFDEMEERFTQLVPNISRISLKLGGSENLLRLVDRHEHLIPTSDISDGTLRLLGFLAALYQVETPNILCFEEPENGVHPWLLHKMVELLNVVSTEGITGKPVQVLITTHSPVLLNYVRPEQVRAVELDTEGRTQVYPLPTDSARFQKAMKAYNGALGELWFSNVFGGNPA